MEPDQDQLIEDAHVIEKVLFELLYDEIRCTPFYQNIVKKWRDEAFKKAYDEAFKVGYEKGVILGIREAILINVEICFPSIIELAQRRVEIMHNQTSLRELQDSIFTAKNSEEAERIFKDIAET